jgi:death-on-curing protein
VIHLTLEELVLVAERAIAGDVVIRDVGLLEAALARPRATAFGSDAYPTLTDKAAALLHSLAKNHALVDGNRRLALAGTIAFLGLNGLRLTYANDEVYELITEVADGTIDSISVLSRELTEHTRAW